LVLNDTEFLVIQTMAMRLNEKESLIWLASHDVSIKHAQFYRIKARLNTLKHMKSETRINDFLEINVRIGLEQLETIIYMSFQNAIKEKDPLRNQKILESIVSMLPTVSAYYEASTTVKEIPSISKENSKGVTNYFENLMNH